MQNLSQMLRLEYIQYKELRRMTKIKTGISDETQAKLKRGEAITQLFIQERNKPVSTEEQIVLLYALRQGWLDDFSKVEFERVKEGAFNFILQNVPDLIKQIIQKREFDDSIKNKLNQAFGEFF